MSGAAMTQNRCVEPRKGHDGRGRDKTVEQHRKSIPARRQGRARDGGELAPAERCRYGKRIAQDGAMKAERRLDRGALARQSLIVYAGAAAGPAGGAAD